MTRAQRFLQEPRARLVFLAIGRALMPLPKPKNKLLKMLKRTSRRGRRVCKLAVVRIRARLQPCRERPSLQSALVAVRPKIRA